LPDGLSPDKFMTLHGALPEQDDNNS